METDILRSEERAPYGKKEIEDIKTIEDLELSEMAIHEIQIIQYSIPDSRSFEIINEVIRRFRERLTH